MWVFKTILSQTKYFLALDNWERWQNIKFVILAVLIFLGFTRKKHLAANTFYNLTDLPSFGKHLRKAILFDAKLARSILDPEHKGVRAWEYGMVLLQIPIRSGLRILDIGTGNSAFPFYLAHNGTKVTCIDLPDPEQKSNQKLLVKYPQVKYDFGSMLALPYKDATFDVVLSISAIEHLQFHITQKRAMSYDKFIQSVRKGVSEMVRVVRPGGRIFITSDAYIPSLQKTDRYSQIHNYKGIGAAFRIDDLEKVFVDTLLKHGCKLIGKGDWSTGFLTKDINRSIYRGRYFTTFSIYAQKKA